MEKYSFTYDVVEQWQVWFDAENDQEAISLMRKIVSEDLNPNELPNFEERNRGIISDFSGSSLECQSDGFRIVKHD